MVVFKAIQSWLNQEISEDPPSGWAHKRAAIRSRIKSIVRHTNEVQGIENHPTTKNVVTTRQIRNVNSTIRQFDIAQVINYNMLKGKDKLRDWKSYPGLEMIIGLAREIMKTGQQSQYILTLSVRLLMCIFA